MSVTTILLTVALLAANAFFVGAEFAAMSARRSQLEPLAEAGSKRAQTALDAMQHTGILLATCQLGITVCSVLLGAISEAALHHALTPIFEDLGASPRPEQLLALREDLRAEEQRLAEGRLDLARRYLDVEHVKVPREEFDAWFGEARDAT